MFTLDVMKISLSSYVYMWMIVYLLKMIYHFLQQQKFKLSKEFDMANNGCLGYSLSIQVY